MSEWIEWQGGERPVALDTVVEVRQRDEDVLRGRARIFRWAWDDGHWLRSADILAYRLAETEQASVHAMSAPATSAPTTATAILSNAAALMEERGKQYDQPQGERSMGRAVAALNAVLGRKALTESEGWLLLQLLKDVRDRQRAEPHPDSLEDGVAYAALKVEARLQETGDKNHG